MPRRSFGPPRNDSKSVSCRTDSLQIFVIARSAATWQSVPHSPPPLFPISRSECGKLLALYLSAIFSDVITICFTRLQPLTLSPTLSWVILASENGSRAVKPGNPWAPTVSVGGAVITYGNFINAILNFLIMALVVFTMIKGINTFHDKAAALAKKKEEEAPPAPPEPSAEEKLLTEIRDLLKEQNK